MEKKKPGWFDCRVISKLLFPLLIAASFYGYGQSAPAIPFTSEPLTVQGDLSALMVAGIDSFLMKETERAAASRNQLWHRDFSDAGSFNRSVSVQRQELSKILGVSDVRRTPGLEVMTGTKLQPLEVQAGNCTIRAVRWKVLEELTAEGLLLEPKGKVRARIIVIPDADELPEVLAGMEHPGGPGYGVARQLAAAGCEVLVPVLLSRQDNFSGSPSLNRYTNQTHREWIYRQAFEVGRHVIGYELQKIFSAIDWMELANRKEGSHAAIGVAGYGEGGLLALYAAALDPRISSTLISGYFDAREALWKEPIYRNVFGLLKYFGDAELSVMAWPRRLVVEESKAPEISGAPAAVKGRSGAAPGSLHTPDFSSAKSEWNRARAMLPENEVHLRWCADGGGAFAEPFSAAALNEFTAALQVSFPKTGSALLKPLIVTDWVDTAKRQELMVRSMERQVQREIILG